MYLYDAMIDICNKQFISIDREQFIYTNLIFYVYKYLSNCVVNGLDRTKLKIKTQNHQ